jgi:hypothetical protein
VSGERSHLWYDGAWPALTGIIAGAGLLAAYSWTGPLMFVVALVLLELAIVPVVWSLLTELGSGGRGVVLRVCFPAALGALAVIGLTDAIEGWAFLLAGGVLVTSPLVRGWSEGGFGPVLRRISPGAETRRRFDDIVAHGFGPPDEGVPTG